MEALLVKHFEGFYIWSKQHKIYVSKAIDEGGLVTTIQLQFSA